MYDLITRNKPGASKNHAGVKVMKSLTSLAYFQVYNPSTLEVYDRESPEFQSSFIQEMSRLKSKHQVDLSTLTTDKRNIFPVMGEVNPGRRSQFTSPIFSGEYAIMGSATPAAASPSS